MTITNLTGHDYATLQTEVEAVIDKARETWATVAADANLTPEGKVNQISAWDREKGWSRDVEAVAAEMQRRTAAAEKAHQVVQDSIGAGTGSAQERLLSEMQSARYWNRTKSAELDTAAGNDHGAVIGAALRLVGNVPDVHLSMVLEELPAYLQSRGVDAGDAVEAAVRRRLPALEAARVAAKRARMLETYVGKMVGYAREVVGKANPPARPSGAPLTYTQLVALEVRLAGDLGDRAA